jgi:hypothetical protein
MKKDKEYPDAVLEAYDTIEKMIVPKEDQPLYEANATTGECLLFMLNRLYEADPAE